MVLTSATWWRFYVVSKSPNEKLFSAKFTWPLKPFKDGVDSQGQAGLIVQLLLNAVRV